MKRKKFIKQLMAMGISRNKANDIAEFTMICHIPYYYEWLRRNISHIENLRREDDRRFIYTLDNWSDVKNQTL